MAIAFVTAPLVTNFARVTARVSSVHFADQQSKYCILGANFVMLSVMFYIIAVELPVLQNVYVIS